MSLWPPKSTFIGTSFSHWLHSLWELCKPAQCRAARSAPETPAASFPMVRWVKEGQVALCAFDFSHHADAVCAFQRETYSVNFPDFRYTSQFARAFRQELRRASLHPNHGLYVLVHYPVIKVIGFLWVILYRNQWSGDNYGYVNNVSVDAAWRSQGLGRALLEQAEDFLRERETFTLRLNVTASNTAAAHLYQSCGYITTRWEMEKKLYN